jgi:hypothetical protein
MVTTAIVESEATNRQEESMEVINSSSLITLSSATSSRLLKVKGYSSLKSSSSRMVLFTKVTLKMVKDMAQVPKFGLMEPNMKVSGDRTKQMVPVNSGMLMEMFTRDNGRMTKQMDTEFTYM